MAELDNTGQNCSLSFRLAKLNLATRGRDNRLPSPFSMMAQVVQSPDAFSGPEHSYIQSVTREAERLANSTYCELATGDKLLIDLTFISANGLTPSEAKILRLPRHGFAKFDANTSVLRAVFVRSLTQTVDDIYRLKTEDDSELIGTPHADQIFQLINTYLDDPSQDTSESVEWLFESVKSTPVDEKLEAIKANLRTIVEGSDPAYISAAGTILKRAVPNSIAEGGYGFKALVAPEVAKTYVSEPQE